MSTTAISIAEDRAALGTVGVPLGRGAVNGRAAVPLSLHIGIEYDRGGAGRVISELMAQLPKAGFRFKGLVGGSPGVSAKTAGMITSFAPSEAGLIPRLMGARRAIRGALNEFEPEIVASHFAMYTAPALDLLKGRRNVSHFHGPWSQESLQEGASRGAIAAKAQLEGTVYRRADRVIVLSKAFGDLVTETFGVAPERVRLVPGSVDIERFNLRCSRKDSRAALGLPEGRPILVTVRRLVQRMGLTSLLDAMSEIVRAVPEVMLCIAGQGPLRAGLEEQVDRLRLRDHVCFLGFVTEEMLPHVFHAADINVVPTTALEGFGLVAAEAMATGTPSMVTPIGGLPEVVGGLSRELIFASARSADLADGLIQALRGELRLPERAACREYVQTNFSSHLMAERTAEVYSELLREGSSKR